MKNSDLFNLQDTVVIITGGSGQLGRQFTRALVDYGAKVAVFDLQSPAKLPPHLNPLPLLGGEGRVKGKNDSPWSFCKVDVTKKNSLVKGLKEVKRIWGIPHALINAAALDFPPNASAATNGPFENYPEKLLDRVLDVNLKGTILACQVIGSAMAKAGRGSIINIGSIYGMVSPDQRLYAYREKKGGSFFKPVTYSVSKAGILNLTRYLATYWAKCGVRVNTLTFGGVFNHQDKKFLKGYASRVPMGRMAREDEYNGAVVFLVSDASSYMTGANMVIDGGWTAW